METDTPSPNVKSEVEPAQVRKRTESVASDRFAGGSDRRVAGRTPAELRDR